MAARVRETVTWNGREVTEKVLQAAEDGVAVAMEYALTQANQSVPLLNSPLMQSGVASTERNARGEITGAVSYSTPYAVRQHEDLTYRHAEGRRAKWLELTFQERQDQISRLVATQVRRRIEGVS